MPAPSKLVRSSLLLVQRLIFVLYASPLFLVLALVLVRSILYPFNPSQFSSGYGVGKLNDFANINSDSEGNSYSSQTSFPVSKQDAPGAGLGKVFWFLQVSDIHVSDRDPSKQEQLEEFIRTTVSTIDPVLVMATGDMTEALRHIWKGAPIGQIEREWRSYQQTVAKFRDSGFWIDLRGNHDTFGVTSTDEDFFLQYSVQGSLASKRARASRPEPSASTSNPVKWSHSRSHILGRLLSTRLTTLSTSSTSSDLAGERDIHLYITQRGKHLSYTLDMGFGVYRFVSLDGSPLRAPSRYFFGLFDTHAVDFLDQELSAKWSPSLPTASHSSGSKHFNQSVVMAHFPLATAHSQLGTNGLTVLETMQSRGAAAFLCGHLHTFGGALNALYARHLPGGLLELELADFKCMYLSCMLLFVSPVHLFACRFADLCVYSFSHSSLPTYGL